MKAKFGAGNVGGVASKGGFIELDDSDVAKAVEAAKGLAPAALGLAALAAWTHSTLQWENPENTAPIGAGPVEVEFEGHTIRGLLANRALSFRCQGRTIRIPTTNIIVVHTIKIVFQRFSRLRVRLTDGSEYKEAEFAPGTVIRLSTAAGDQELRPKFRNRWNPFPFSKGYSRFRVVGAPLEAMRTVQAVLHPRAQLPD